MTKIEPANLLLKDKNGNIGLVKSLTSKDITTLKNVVINVDYIKDFVNANGGSLPVQGDLRLTATDAAGKNGKILLGTSSGTLQWNGKNIVRSVNGVNADAQGNVSITSVNHATSADSATSALKAQQDANGNNIVQTYATKAENINVLNQAKTDASQKYLPLTGGALTGNLAVRAVLRENTNNGLSLVGGTDWDNGARLVLNGKDNKDVKGGFDLGACDGKSTVLLSGRADGTLYWGTKHLVRSINGIGADVSGNVVLGQSIAISASGTNYIRFANGTQICWGYVEYDNTISANVTLPVPFANTSYQVVCTDTGDGRFPLGAATVATTYFTAYLPSTFIGFRYIAIGSWK